MSMTLPTENHSDAPIEPGEVRQAELTYGSDDAPVLLQLPNLAMAVSVPSPSESAAPTDELAPVEPPAESPSTDLETSVADGEAEAEETAAPTPDRHQRRIQRNQRQAQESKSPLWLRNLGQYAFAVVLASVLFAIIVMFKERNNEVSSSNSPPPSQEIGMPDWDEVHQPVLVPAVSHSDAGSDWGTSPAADDSVPSPATATAANPAALDPSAFNGASAPGLGVPDFRMARQPQELERSATPTVPYPSTGVPPVGGSSSEGWSETGRFEPTRQANRSNSDQRSR